MILCLGCTPESVPANLEPQTDPPPPQARITRIPIFQPVISFQPTPLPFPEQGLRFQRANRLPSSDKKASDGNTSDNKKSAMKWMAPIGEARFGPDGHLFMSFPRRDLVIRVDRETWQLQYMGPKHQGGNGEIIKQPGVLSIVGNHLFLANRENGQVLVLDRKGNFVNAFEVGYTGALAGPEQTFVVPMPHGHGVFGRVDHRGTLLQQFSLEASLTGQPFRGSLRYHLTPEAQIIAVRDDGSQLAHVSEGPEIIRYLLPEFVNWPSPPRIEAVFFRSQFYYLLLSCTTPQPESFLIKLDQTGQAIAQWSCPFFADGMDWSREHLVLYARERGTAQTFSIAGNNSP